MYIFPKLCKVCPANPNPLNCGFFVFNSVVIYEIELRFLRPHWFSAGAFFMGAKQSEL
jgi:hypothetical protein